MTVGETETPLVVVVRAEDEARATEALRDLAGASTASRAPSPDAASRASSLTPPSARVMSSDPATASSAAATVELVDTDTGARLGRITDAQLASLHAHLERESSVDDDYYIDEATITMLEDKGADAATLGVLRNALGGREGVNVRWARE